MSDFKRVLFDKVVKLKTYLNVQGKLGSYSKHFAEAFMKHNLLQFFAHTLQTFMHDRNLFKFALNVHCQEKINK